MHANTLAPTRGPLPLPAFPAMAATSRHADRIRRLEAFEATGLPVLRAAYPGLRHERKGLQIEWFMSAGRLLRGEGVPLEGTLALDTPCCDETSELLDAMAEANDPMLGRKDLDEAISDEVTFLDGRLRESLGWMHRTVRGHLAKIKNREIRIYLSALERELALRPIELFPVESQAAGARYKPAAHVRQVIEAALSRAGAAKPVRAAKRNAAPTKRAEAPATPKLKRGRPEQRPSRPFRMRRYSALYE